MFERQINEDGRWRAEGAPVEVPKRSLMVAAGTSPNIIYETEHEGTFALDVKFFRRFEPHWSGNDGPTLEAADDGTIPKVAAPAPFTSYEQDGRYISFFGDNHPVYAGNVVKAMASAKDGYPYIVRLFERELETRGAAEQGRRDAELESLIATLDDQLMATVEQVHRLTPTIVEVVARAPMAAHKFNPGQFYRIQNLESGAPVVEDTSLAAEALALTGAWVDREKGLISLITLEMGTSSKLCALWEPGQQIVVMGPTGTPTEIPRNETVLLAGGGLGNAVLFSIGKAMREAGNRVIYFAGYKTIDGVFKVEEIEAASDIVVWAVDPLPGAEAIPTTRPQDKTFVGNIVEAMLAYATGELGDTPVALSDADRIIAIGSDGMMAAVKAARYGVLKPHLKEKHTAIGSINSSMQCMMKGVCAQCLCRHEDPETGEESFVYSCYNQDQILDEVDFSNLRQRLRQNSVQEKLSDLWLDHLLEEYRQH
jgi:NAD(P)H-flavin reductase